MNVFPDSLYIQYILFHCKLLLIFLEMWWLWTTWRYNPNIKRTENVRINKKFWEELIAYLPLIWHWPNRKRCLQQFFIAMRTCLMSRCLAMKGGIHFTKPLPSNDRRYTHTDWWEGFMKYIIEMGSGAIIYIPSFIKIGSGIQKLIGGGGIHRQHGDCLSLLLFFQNKKRRLKNKYSLPKYGCTWAF
jgi:hypothetical protein